MRPELHEPASATVPAAAHRGADASVAAPPARRFRRRRRRLLRLRGTARERGWIYPAAVAVSAVVLGFAATQAPRAAMIASAGAGALFVLRQRAAAWIVVAMMIANFVLVPGARFSDAAWSLTLLMLVAATASARSVPVLLRMPNWTWALSMVLGAVCVAASTAPVPLAAHLAVALGSVFMAYLGAGLARHPAMSDARLLSWDEDGLVPVTRDLLLGRLTDGMLHNLAQPLNVISMANGNIGYIVEHLDIDAASRGQIAERIDRIAGHTEAAADVLALFRSLGRDAAESGDRHDHHDQPTIRRVIDRAVAATRFTVRHHVSVVVTGGALDNPVPGRQGTLEILGVAALLSAFGAFAGRDGTKHRGTVVVRAELSPAHVVITVSCVDEEERERPCRVLDAATLWLVEQVAREGGGDFLCVPHGARPTELILRLGRDDLTAAKVSAGAIGSRSRRRRSARGTG